MRKIAGTGLIKAAGSSLARPSFVASSLVRRHYSRSHHENKTGILAIETYFPSTYVSQEELEEHDGVGKGKYTVGLGQHNMAVCGEAEDINSICLTAVQNLLEKYSLDPKDIGRLEVGTETVVDKSKAVKTTLMDLFKASKNTSIEGVDTSNACYGGTNALFNALNWVESGHWDGRYAIVVAADIAVYEKGPARPTGGAGAVAMLVGPNAPIYFEHGLRGSYFENAYDFYKPVLSSEYPVVDGKLSNECYLRALDSCFFQYKARFDKHHHGQHGDRFDVQKDVDFALFHSPYTKLVQKSWARLAFLDFVGDRLHKRHSHNPLHGKEFASFFKPDGSVDLEATYDNKDLAKVLQKETDASYRAKVLPSLTLAMELGNSYCASLYCSIHSLVSHLHKHKVDTHQGKRALLFSYGSGLAATMFSMKIQGDINAIAKTSAFEDRLKRRTKLSPLQYEATLARREQVHCAPSFTPSVGGQHLFPGTFYLANTDDKYRRSYARV